GKADGEIVKILKRAHATVVGEFRLKRRGWWVQPYDERIQQWVRIPEGMERPETNVSRDRVGVKPVEIASPEDMDGMIVNVEILDFGEEDGETVGRVIEILGYPDDFGVDVEIIIRKHHIPHEFPTDVLEQARNIPSVIDEAEIARRQDFRSLDIVTIDGETARDFDDAVWVERLKNGNYALQVHIADVSHYVRPGSPIDQEALKRGTSVYFPDRAVPMLPVELSTDICSLRPQLDRLVLSALMEIDHRGDVVAQAFTRGVIRSAHRMTYTQVHQILEGDRELRETYEPMVPRFELMRELALILNRKRQKRGSIDFDLPEPLIEFDEFGEMTGVVRSPRNIAHRIIEEFMLAANEAVAGHLEARAIPSVYRIHEVPDPKRVLDFEELAVTFGYSLGIGAMPVKRFRNVQHVGRAPARDGRKPRRDVEIADPSFTISSRNYQKLIAQIEGKPEERILSYLMLRSLKQARYSEENRGHFALAAASYTHFTSPIRRYPDLMVHRILAAQIEGKAPKWDNDQLHAMADECSGSERRAAEAERELVEWKKAKFMIDRVGEEFPALIISTTRFGFFVELETLFIEGLVPVETLPGDRYTFHENTRKIVGERSRREFSIGGRVDVRLDRVDAVEKKLQFSLVEPEPARPRRKRKKYE
ncbi:MAG TPA: RNB domain-containing ribonuclease, partial [Tepidiformaceae bacterium]|nr:RNB domain-containing ribonuclease [Tepidiformaceae bacterium]